MMYREAFNQDGSRRHAKACQGAFGHYDPRCHRCLELRRGAAPRPGWKKKPNPDQRCLNFENH